VQAPERELHRDRLRHHDRVSPFGRDLDDLAQKPARRGLVEPGDEHVARFQIA
jgi:hypothetical protein